MLPSVFNIVIYNSLLSIFTSEIKNFNYNINNNMPLS